MQWNIEKSPVEYPTAISIMEKRVEDMLAGNADELVWLVEHPPLYTAGTSAKSSELLHSTLPTYHTGRGGQWTYHGPGQRIAYVMLDLKKRNAMDIRCYVRSLENWIISTLAAFDVEGFIRDGRVGVWVQDRTQPSIENKIAAIGIRVRKWVTYHGIAINVNPDLSHYAGIIPCGIKEHGVTSLAALGKKISMDEIDRVLQQEFEKNVLKTACDATSPSAKYQVSSMSS